MSAEFRVGLHDFSGYRRVDVTRRLDRFDNRARILGGELSANLRSFGENDVCEFRLRMVGNADGADVTVDTDPFVRFGELQILGNIHDFGL